MLLLQAPEVALDVQQDTGNLLEGDAARLATHGALEPGIMPSPPRRETREREMLNAYNELGAAKEVRQGSDVTCYA